MCLAFVLIFPPSAPAGACGSLLGDKWNTFVFIPFCHVNGYLAGPSFFWSPLIFLRNAFCSGFSFFVGVDVSTVPREGDYWRPLAEEWWSAQPPYPVSQVAFFFLLQFNVSRSVFSTSPKFSALFLPHQLVVFPGFSTRSRLALTCHRFHAASPCPF